VPFDEGRGVIVAKLPSNWQRDPLGAFAPATPKAADGCMSYSLLITRAEPGEDTMERPEPTAKSEAHTLRVRYFLLCTDDLTRKLSISGKAAAQPHH
jgi:hypothetical protein